jgi:hypothetical protein
MRHQTLRSQVVEALKNKIKEPEDRRLDKILLDLNQRNKFKQRLSGDGFLYAGAHEIPKFNANKLPPKGELKGLNPELFDEMEALIEQRKTSELNISFCAQILYRLLEGCESLQDVRDALPDHLWLLYDHKGHIERQRPELWTIQNNPKLLSQYHQFEQIMAVFMVGRMMY